MLSIRDVPCGGFIEDEATGRQASRPSLQRSAFSKQIYAAIAPSQTHAGSVGKPLQFVTLALFLCIMRLWIASKGSARAAAGINRGCRIANSLVGNIGLVDDVPPMLRCPVCGCASSHGLGPLSDESLGKFLRWSVLESWHIICVPRFIVRSGETCGEDERC